MYGILYNINGIEINANNEWVFNLLEPGQFSQAMNNIQARNIWDNSRSRLLARVDLDTSNQPGWITTDGQFGLEGVNVLIRNNSRYTFHDELGNTVPSNQVRSATLKIGHSRLVNSRNQEDVVNHRATVTSPILIGPYPDQEVIINSDLTTEVRSTVIDNSQLKQILITNCDRMGTLLQGRPESREPDIFLGVIPANHQLPFPVPE